MHLTVLSEQERLGAEYTLSGGSAKKDKKKTSASDVKTEAGVSVPDKAPTGPSTKTLEREGKKGQVAAAETPAIGGGGAAQRKRASSSATAAAWVAPILEATMEALAVSAQVAWPRSPRALTALPAAGFSLPKAAMRSILKEVTANPYATPFLEPVDPEVAPGYLDLIKKPMDLQTVKKRLVTGVYKHPADFVVDMRLIWENCVTYNDPESEIASWAVILGDFFEEQLGVMLEEDEEAEAAPASASGKKRTSTAATSGKSPELAAAEADTSASAKADADGDGEHAESGKRCQMPLSVRKMRKLMRELYKHEQSEPFHYPVDLSAVEGYSALIKQPMDFSTIKANINSFEDDPPAFLANLMLVYDNCQKFNVEDSDLHKAAGVLKQLTLTRFNEYFPPMGAHNSPTGAPTNRPRGPRQKKAADTGAHAEAEADATVAAAAGDMQAAVAGENLSHAVPTGEMAVPTDSATVSAVVPSVTSPAAIGSSSVEAPAQTKHLESAAPSSSTNSSTSSEHQK